MLVSSNCAKCMSLIIGNQSVKKVDRFCPRVDVVPDYRLITRGSMSQSFNQFAYMAINVRGGFWA